MEATRTHILESAEVDDSSRLELQQGPRIVHGQWNGCETPRGTVVGRLCDTKMRTRLYSHLWIASTRARVMPRSTKVLPHVCFTVACHAEPNMTHLIVNAWSSGMAGEGSFQEEDESSSVLPTEGAHLQGGTEGESRERDDDFAAGCPLFSPRPHPGSFRANACGAHGLPLLLV